MGKPSSRLSQAEGKAEKALTALKYAEADFIYWGCDELLKIELETRFGNIDAEREQTGWIEGFNEQLTLILSREEVACDAEPMQFIAIKQYAKALTAYTMAESALMKIRQCKRD